MAKLILASHGELSKGMLNSVQMIIGDITCDIETFCLYPGENPADFAKQIQERIINKPDHYIIVCDIKGGSVYNALVQTCVFNQVDVLSGMNMNLVLELILAMQTENINLEEIVSHAQEGITYKNKSLINTNIEEEDF